ncbi:uncharacterized protein BDW70DRAFT_16448 [Aspergillus foveolatus]|uniref:uncharacterized protein n=1 Tax=Aspergillus foveolatus TaxID=210207 RepID=UPI003CCCB168
MAFRILLLLLQGFHWLMQCSDQRRLKGGGHRTLDVAPLEMCVHETSHDNRHRMLIFNSEHALRESGTNPWSMIHKLNSVRNAAGTL